MDGTVVSISDFVIDGKAYGSRIDVRPSAAPSLIVTLSHLEPDPSLAVGSPVLASSSKLGTVVDVAAVERQALAKHARARGNNVAIDVHPAAGSLPLNILFVGDVVGRPGREALEDRLAALRAELDVAVCIVNGENVADGVGITPKLAERLLAAGADAITLGNHTWRRQEIAPVPRHAPTASSGRRTSPPTRPGRGLTIVAAADGTQVAVVNVMGSLSLQPARSMWELVDELVDEARATTPVVLVDVHAEATSEKVALARWLDGRVTAVIGTHTHVQTADARVQPGGTAAITDAGHDGPARLGDRRQGRAGDAPHAHRDAGALRGRDGRRPDRGRARRVRPRERPGDRDQAGSGSLALSARTRTTRTAKTPTSRGRGRARATTPSDRTASRDPSRCAGTTAG